MIIHLKLDDFEKAAFLISRGKSINKRELLLFGLFSYRMKVLFLTAEQIAEAAHAKNLGTEHVS